MGEIPSHVLEAIARGGITYQKDGPLGPNIKIAFQRPITGIDIGVIASDFADALPADIVGVQTNFGLPIEKPVQYFVVNQPTEGTGTMYQRPNYRIGESIALMERNPVPAVVIRRDSGCAHDFGLMEAYKARLERLIEAKSHDEFK